MSELRRCRGTWAYCDGDCSRCTTTATTQTSMMYLIQPTSDVMERKDLDKIAEAHEKIGYEKGYRDGYAQAIEDAIEVVGINTWAGSRITKLQHAQPTTDVQEVRCRDCKNLSEDRIAPEWNRICRKYGCGKSDDGYCDEFKRKEIEDGEIH